MKEPSEGDLRVWWVPQAPCKAFEVPVATVEQGAIILNVLAEYDAFQLIQRIKPDYSNAGGLQQFIDGEWLDWEDETTFDQEPDAVYPQLSLGYCANLPS